MSYFDEEFTSMSNQTRAALLATGSRLPSYSITYIGQSTEHGAVPITDTSYPQAFQSVRNPAVQIPIYPAVTNQGGWHMKVYDDLYDWGWDSQIANCAIGSMSMMTQAAGYVKYRGDNTPYYGRRGPITSGDRGYLGDVMSPDGTSMWTCITGNYFGAMSNGPRTVGDAGFGSVYVDFIASLPSVVGPNKLVNLSTSFPATFVANTNSDNTLVVTSVSAGKLSVGQRVSCPGVPSGTTIIGPVVTPGSGGGVGTYTLSANTTATATGQSGTTLNPTFPNNVGQVVQDGDIVWQCLSTTTASPYANSGTVCSETQKGWGWDPLGIVQRGMEEAQKMRGVSRRFIYIANGQADVGLGVSLYQKALTNVATFYLNRGFEVILGFTSYSPASTGTIAAWNDLQTGWSNTLSALQSAFPGKVWQGANLYASMGTTGVMGGAVVTAGSISGGTLNVTTLKQGTIEVGHNVWRGTTLVGIVSSGSGSTWTLSNSTDVAAFTTTGTPLIVAGTNFQYDGVHPTGAACVGPPSGGVSCAGSFVSAAIKNILPKTPWATV